MKRTTRTLAALVGAGLLAAHAPSAQASISPRVAGRLALDALGVAKSTSPVIVFGVDQPLRPGARISQAGTVRQPRGRASAAGVVASAAPSVAGLRLPGERAYFFFADDAPYGAYEHAGRVVLVGRESGRVRVSRRLAWPPLIDDRLPAFMRSADAYADPEHRVFRRVPGMDAPDAGWPSLRAAAPGANARAAGLLATGRSCVVQVSDTLGDVYGFGDAAQTRARLRSLFDGLEQLSPGFVAERYTRRGDVSPTAFTERLVRERGCRDVLLHLAGGAWAGERTPAVAVGTRPGARLRQQLVKVADVRALLRAHRDVTFSVVVDAAHASTFTASLTKEENALLVAAPSGSWQRAAIGERLAALPGGQIAGHPRMLALTERTLAGLERGTACGAELEAVAAAQPSSFLAALLARGLATTASAAACPAPALPGSSNPSTSPTPAPPPGPVYATTSEDTPVTIALASTDGLSAPSHGSLTSDATTVTYTPAPDFNGTDTFDYRDGTVTITVEPVNDAATASTATTALVYTEGDPAIAVDPGLTASDVDDALLERATVRIDEGREPGDELRFTDTNAITGDYDDGTLTLTGSASVAAYEAALRTVAFIHTGDAPGSDRTLAIALDDGDGLGPAATRELAITPVNDAPTVSASSGRATFAEGDSPVAIDPGLLVADPDSALLSGAAVRIVTAFAPGQDVLAFTDQNGITGAYGAGTLTLTGVATVAAYQAALRSVTYGNGSAAPSTQTRAIDFRVTDLGGLESAAGVRELAVAAAADAPVVTTSAGMLNYTEGDPATAIDGALTVTDPDDAQLTGATVRITAGLQAADVLEVTAQAPITGTYDAGTLTLTGAAPVAAYEAALRSVRYRHTGDAPSTPKTVQFVADDGTLASAPAVRTIAVTPVNDAPQVTTSGTPLPYAENAGAVAVDPGLTVADPDSSLTGASARISGDFQAAQDRLAFTAQQGITGAYDEGTGVLTLTGTAAPAAYQAALRSVTYANLSDGPAPATRAITFQAGDGTATSAGATRSVAIAAANDAPAAGNDAGATDEDTTLSVTAPGVLSNDTDPDPGDSRTVTRLNGSATLTGTSAKGAAVTITSAGAFTYAPGTIFQSLAAGQTDTDSFTYTLQDAAGASATATVTLTITGVSDAPIPTADTFDAIGNTTLHVGTTRSAAEPAKEIAGSILSNDSDPDTPAASLVAEPVTNAPTALGGTITIEGDGNFTYRPDDGDTGDDTFTYRVCDASPCTAGTVANATATLTLRLAGEVWYVRNDAAAGGDGTSDAPLDTLAEAETASGAGDTVYVLRGDGTSADLDTGYALAPNERLIGEHAGLALGGFTLHPATAGARPTLTASNEDVVQLASGATVEGITVDPSGTGGGVSGTGGVSGATLTGVVINDTGTAATQPGLDLDATTGTTTVANLAVTTSGAVGVRLANAGTVDFGATAITTTGARGLDATGTSLSTSTFDSITVTGSATGGVRLADTTGAVTFGALSLSTTGGSGFALSNAGGVTVAAAGTANVTASNGPAIDVAGAPGATLVFDALNSLNSPGDGVNLAGLGTGTFNASGGLIAGAAGIAIDVEGGSGSIGLPILVNNGSGQSAEITGRTGGTVIFTGEINDSNDAGGGISLSGNSGGSTTFVSSPALDTGSSDAVAMTASDGHTLTFTGGGLDIDTTSGRGLAATTSGTLAVSGTGNTIDTTTGRALTITSTDIGAATFQRISSNGAPNGILLDTTGSAAGLTITGNGGTCTAANTSGCTGGEIRNAPGADDSGTTPVGTGIVLKDTTAPSLTRVWIHDHANYGIRGTDVAGFTLADSVVNGTNGTNGTTPFDDSSVWFTNLTGSASVARTAVSGGLEDNFRVNNATGSLNRITFSAVTMGLNSSADGNDSLSLQSQASAGQLHATIESSTFTGARGDQVDFQHNGSGTGDLDITGSAFSNAHPGIATGGGGLTLSNAGTSGNTAMDITGNTFRDAVGPGVLVVKTAGTANQTGTFANNTLGVAGVPNSGSAEGSALKLQSVDRGTLGWTVTGNQIRGYNNFGIEVLAGGGSTPQTGTVNATITGNTIAQPGTTPGTLTIPKQGVHLNIGTVPGDTFAACAAITGNNLADAGADGVPATGVNVDVRLRQRQSSTIRLPGYTGGATDTAAVQSFVAANNPGGTSVLAQVNAPPGGGFTGTGTTCP